MIMWTEHSVGQIMPAALHSREEVVGRLLTTFRSAGYDGASLADIAAATGLGRSSLYHHFPGGKEEMGAAVFDLIDSWLDAEIVEQSLGSGTPAERLDRMITAIDSFYEGGRKRCILGAFVVGQSRRLFGARLAMAFERWIAAFANLARDSGATTMEARHRAEAAVTAIQGAVVLAAALDDPKSFRAMLADLPARLLSADRR